MSVMEHRSVEQAGAAPSMVEVLREVRALQARNDWRGAVTVKVFRNYAAEFVEPHLKYWFGQAGLRCDVSFGGYDMIIQELLDDSGASGCDLIVLSLRLEGFDRGGVVTVDTARVLQQVTAMADLALERSQCPIVLNSFIRPVVDAGGLADALSADAPGARVSELNRALAAYAAGKAPRCIMVDWERLVMRVGWDAAMDRRMAYIAAAPFRHGFLNAYAREIARVGRALRGAAKKCLLLDCDNTLWGGIVGEAGRDGIELDPNIYPGKAYYDFQRTIAQVAEQGVMVGLCSKNNEADVLDVLDNHPHSLLKQRHLVGHRINWEDKERNIEALVEELNIGMDAVVFVDDSAIECERVKSFLPDLTVLSVPKQLWDLPLIFEGKGLFDRLAVTEEDRRRTERYRVEAVRRQSAAGFKDTDQFLASLALKAKIAAADAKTATRVAQLAQKTNQFNLTTRRYAEAEIAAMTASPDHAVFTLTAGDKFGELGLTGVFIARRDGDDATIDTLLMSCRVLGRKLEHAFVATCIETLQQRWQPRRWHAEFLPTAKNAQVADFWPRFGFDEAAKTERGTSYHGEFARLRLPHIPYITVETQ